MYENWTPLKTSILVVWCAKLLSAILKYLGILRFSKVVFLSANRGERFLEVLTWWD